MGGLDYLSVSDVHDGVAVGSAGSVVDDVAGLELAHGRRPVAVRSHHGPPTDRHVGENIARMWNVDPEVAAHHTKKPNAIYSLRRAAAGDIGDAEIAHRVLHGPVLKIGATRARGEAAPGSETARDKAAGLEDARAQPAGGVDATPTLI